MNEPPTEGQAFLKGGCGCLLAFAVLSVLVALIGGRVRVGLGGFIILFIIGGAFGLILLAAYMRGRRDGGG